jgi:predicted  nucleic acid-binding Zn-ribbon protein
MTQAEQERLREFSQKMRDEGSAGFANGPWDDAEIDGDDSPSTKQRQKKHRTTNSSRRARQRTIGDRVLTWLAILALITLIAGLTGTWLSYQPKPGVTATRADRMNRASDIEHVASRLTRMEKRLSHILDPYIRMLNKLSGKLDDTQKRLNEHIQNTGQQAATTPTGIEERLENIEQQLAAAGERMGNVEQQRAATDERTGNVEQQRVATDERIGNIEQQRAATDERIGNIEQQRAATDERIGNIEQQRAATGERMVNVEQQLTATKERMENLEQQLAAVNERMHTLSGMLVALADDTPKSAAGTHQPAPPPTPATTGSPGTGKPAAPAAEQVPEPEPELPVVAAQQPIVANPAGSQIEATEKPLEITPEPVPATAPEPAAPVAAGKAAGTTNGNWVINVASYTNENIARRKLAQMQQQGVDVELVTAEVNGKTIYRARVFGFTSRRDAETHAVGIRAKLGIKETWITKR